MTPKAISLKGMVVAIVGVVARTIIEPMLWIPMSKKGIGLISLKEINQGHLVDIYIHWDNKV